MRTAPLSNSRITDARVMNLEAYTVYICPGSHAISPRQDDGKAVEEAVNRVPFSLNTCFSKPPSKACRNLGNESNKVKEASERKEVKEREEVNEVKAVRPDLTHDIFP